MRTIRPLQTDVYKLATPGSVCPQCQWKFRGWAEIASHWKSGHFDYTTEKPMTPPEAMNEVVDLHNTIRTLRAGLRTKSNLVNDTFTGLVEALIELERRLNALAAEVGKLKA